LGEKLKEADAVALIGIFGQVGKPDCVPALLPHLRSPSAALRTAALGALQGFQDGSIASSILAAWPELTGPLKTRALSLLTSRPPSALELLNCVAAGSIKPAEIP